MSKYKYSDEELINAVKESFSISNVCRILGIKAAGGNYTTIKNKIKKLNLDTSHFTGQLWSKGKKLGPNEKASKPLSEILVKDSSYQSYKLAKRLLNANLKEKFCENCKSTLWLGNPIPLELHHINGVSSDNRIENLQLLCPNCHALTDNYRGKNIGMSAQEETLDVEQP